MHHLNNCMSVALMLCERRWWLHSLIVSSGWAICIRMTVVRVRRSGRDEVGRLSTTGQCRSLVRPVVAATKPTHRQLGHRPFFDSLYSSQSASSRDQRPAADLIPPMSLGNPTLSLLHSTFTGLGSCCFFFCSQAHTQLCTPLSACLCALLCRQPNRTNCTCRLRYPSSAGVLTRKGAHRDFDHKHAVLQLGGLDVLQVRGRRHADGAVGVDLNGTPALS